MVNKEEFEKVCKELEYGIQLNCMQLGRIFGDEFWSLLVLCMSGSKEAGQVFDQLVEAARAKCETTIQS